MRTSAFAPSTAEVAETFGERDITYIETAKPVFEDMRQIVSQLAGLLLLSEAVSGHGFVVRDLLARSHELLADASAAVDALKPSARGQHHHLHMRKAIEELVTSLTMAEETAKGLNLGDRGFRAVTVAWQELIHASNALPGFERVDLSQSCCAQHFVKLSRPVFGCQGVIL